ncbi:hypothetical protein DFH08DRAFT_957353 [Mycena albidolilacea]|uniref:Uncharacterized protein n=1 Tax=Mycena albidolilacea TaxID=1033008 RepID=A0AAD7AA92_9AGAR|nr:hypothetical protein DFH08DRAFT_957353 [Mycena albidolilacea]
MSFSISSSVYALASAQRTSSSSTSTRISGPPAASSPLKYMAAFTRNGPQSAWSLVQVLRSRSACSNVYALAPSITAGSTSNDEFPSIIVQADARLVHWDH